MNRPSTQSPAEPAVAGHSETAPVPVARPVPRFRALALAGSVFVAVAFALRVALFFKVRGEGDLSIARLPLALLVGVVYDLAAFAYAAIPVVLYLVLLPDRLWRSRVHRVLAFAFWCLFVYALLLEATAEWYFFEEFGARFNFVAVDYLVYTGEVVGNIRETYPVAWILPALAIATALVVVATRRRLASALDAGGPLRGRVATGLACLAVPAIAWVCLDDRLAHVGENRYENELAMNGVYAFGDAFWKNSLSYEQFYAMRDRTQMYSRLREIVSRDGSVPVSADPFDLRRRVTHDGPERRSNVILVTVESLSARYMEFAGGVLGKAHTTPRLDALAAQSLLFTRMYSTGTRTVRGLEALTVSVPPTPGQSVVKRPGSENLFSTGFLFKERGYDTKFVYGGYGLFDNMNAFFASNGFTSVDRTDFADDERTFGNVWGVSDEDLFRRVGREADRSHAAGHPFFLHVMTTSNHQPYTYPDGRIDIPSGTGRSGAAKYTDYAIGKFLDDARARPWFDVPPTLLGLLNWSYETKFFGQDVLRRAPGRALLCNYVHVGLYDGRRLATLGPHRDVRVDDIDADWRSHGVAEDDAFASDAIAYYQSASDALLRGLLGRIGDRR